MDPLHPIIPIAPNIPPISPSPMVGGVSRDSARGGGGQDRRRRRDTAGSAGGGDSVSASYDGLEYADDEFDGDDDSGLHINVTA
jgi:hypothetical protein